MLKPFPKQRPKQANKKWTELKPLAGLLAYDPTPSDKGGGGLAPPSLEGMNVRPDVKEGAVATGIDPRPPRVRPERRGNNL